MKPKEPLKLMPIEEFEKYVATIAQVSKPKDEPPIESTGSLDATLLPYAGWAGDCWAGKGRSRA